MVSSYTGIITNVPSYTPVLLNTHVFGTTVPGAKTISVPAKQFIVIGIADNKITRHRTKTILPFSILCHPRLRGDDKGF